MEELFDNWNEIPTKIVEATNAGCEVVIVISPAGYCYVEVLGKQCNYKAEGNNAVECVDECLSAIKNNVSNISG